MPVVRSVSPVKTPILARPDFLDAVRAVGRGEEGAFALVVVDLDRFDELNDTFGVALGDAVLETVASVIVRSAGSDAIVGRVDGDKFGILLPTPSTVVAGCIARHVLASMAKPVHVGGSSHFLGARAGISMVVGGPDPVTATLRRAHAALRNAKATRSATPVTYRPDRALERRSQLGPALVEAFERHQLMLAYQPVVELDTGVVLGFEALLRWPTEQRTEIPPSEFVPVAEELGSIVPIGRWALDRAVARASALCAAGAPDPSVAVNLSPRQLGDPELLARIEGSLGAHGLEPSRLFLEVTEAHLVDNRRAVNVLRSARKIGCRIALDDFGTGYSCLGYLGSLPLDVIKIDRSFVRKLGRDRRVQRIVAAIVTLADDLGLTTVAEGVETELQRRRAIAAGCARGQGFLFGRPTFEPEDAYLTPFGADQRRSKQCKEMT